MNTVVAKLLPILAILSLLLLNIRPVRGQNPAADDFDRTAVVGHKEDARHVAYEVVSTKNGPLVGFEFGIGNRPPFVQVSAFRPIFQGETTARPAAGRFEDGTVKGKKVKTPVHTKEKVVAKDGYAVSKVVVQYGLWIDSIQIHFAKIKGDRLDLTDAYHTNSYGSDQAKGKYTTLDAEGRQIVGVTGTMDDVKATGFGLIVSGKLSSKPAEPQPAKTQPAKPQRVVVAPRPQPELGGVDRKSTPNGGSTVKLPAFDTPKSAPSKPAPPRETEAEVKARIEKQSAEAKKQIERFEQFAADANKREAEFNKAFAAMPKWDPTVHDEEAAKEVWRKALDAAEADPNLTDEKRARIAQFRQALGLEPRTNWLAIGVGLGVFGLVGGAGAYFYLQRKPAALPVARRVADDVDAEPLELDDDEPRSPRDSRRSSRV